MNTGAWIATADKLVAEVAVLLSFLSVAFPVMIDSFLYSIAVVFMASYGIVVVSYMCKPGFRTEYQAFCRSCLVTF